jgi:hypothetical protein
VEVRLERSERTLRSNGPQGEPRSGESSSITDQIQKNPTLRLVFCFLRQHNCLMAASPYQAYAIQQNPQFRRPDKRLRAIRQNP